MAKRARIIVVGCSLFGCAVAQALSAAGLDEEEDLFSPVSRAFRGRLLWLGVNLLTAFLAASVVGRFEGSIQQLTALAVLMPMSAPTKATTALMVVATSCA